MFPKSQYLLVVVALLWLALPLQSQVPTIQDCLGAVPVCQEVYSESLSPSGTGNYPNEIFPGETCTDGELNSIWYIFTANANGNLGFLITPNNINDDYDWALFNLTDATCADVGPATLVSCNAAGGGPCDGLTGATGATNEDNQGAGCNFGNSPFNALVPMQAGETFVLMVSNWTGSNNGYEIDFGLSSGIGIFDETPPALEAVTRVPQRCGDNRIELTFNEFLRCSTVNGFDFRLEGPGGPYTLTAFSPICAQGGSQSNSFQLNISPPIAAMGNFTLFIDALNANELLDLCGNSALDAQYNFSVDVPLTLSPSLGADTSLVCVGDTLLLNAGGPGRLAYLWTDGSTDSTLAVTQAGRYEVTITEVCGSGVADINVLVQTEPPTVALGEDALLCAGDSRQLDVTNDRASYLWQDGNTSPSRLITPANAGVYAVTVSNACGEVVDSIDLAAVPALNLSLEPELGACAGDTIRVDLGAPFATYLWSDGSTSPSRAITANGAFAVTVTTPCETWMAQTQTFFLVDPTLDLGDDQTRCTGDTLLLDTQLPGLAYRWQDGSTDQRLLVTGPGEYAVTVTTTCGELTDRVQVNYVPAIGTELGRDTFLCEKDVLWLDANAGATATYRWEDGSTDARRRVQGPGEYVVEVTSACQTLTDTLRATLCEQCLVYAPTAFSPNDDGVNDRWRPLGGCPFAAYQLRIFDRWGSLLFQSDDPEAGWNGRTRDQDLLPGLYVFVLEYTVLEDGIARSEVTRGEVVLLR